MTEDDDGSRSRALSRRVGASELITSRSGKEARSTMPSEKLFEVNLIGAITDAISPENVKRYDRCDPWRMKNDDLHFSVLDKKIFIPAPKIQEPKIPGALVYTHNPDRIEEVAVDVELERFKITSGRETIEVDVTIQYKSTDLRSSLEEPRKVKTTLPDGNVLISEIPLGDENTSPYEGATRKGKECPLVDRVESLLREVMIPEGFETVGYESRHCPEGAIKINTSACRIDEHSDMGREYGMSVTWSMEINRKDLPALREHLASKLGQVEGASGAVERLRRGAAKRLPSLDL